MGELRELEALRAYIFHGRVEHPLVRRMLELLDGRKDVTADEVQTAIEQARAELARTRRGDL